MKKILIILVLFSSTLAGKAQLSGGGTLASPYSGTFQNDLQWNSTNFSNSKVYINGDVTIDNELLTIGAGMTIVFLSEGADLIISGTGRIDASGTSGSKITFTADDDNDGSFGEAGERWGHIYFNGPSETNQSKIDYCIIEFGDVHTFSDSQGYGGAIHSNYSNLIISNSTLRNNWAEWGGAVFVNASKTPSIKNCIILSNKSDRGGGGVYCWNSSGSVIENCIFDSNQCLETSIAYYTGGGLAGQSGTSIKVLNCTFVNNTSARPEGQALLLHTSANARVVNCIFWGAPDKQIYCYGTSGGIIINSAYRGITYASGSPVSPVLLNSSNNASDGPNFVATNGTDWSLLWVSPCRDAGVNTYTGVTIPSTDYAYKQRVYNKDIGAYEYQYSRWNGTTSDQWSTATNWDGSVDPATGTGEVVIPTGLSTYPTGTTTQDFTISAGKQMIIEQGGRVTLDDLTNNGILKLNHAQNTNGFASLIINSYTRGTGATEEIQLYLAGGGTEDNDDYKWHYISSPVSSLSTDVFTGTGGSITLDLAQFVENRPSTSVLEGWVAYDGYVYFGGGTGPTFSSLSVGKGYNFWDGANNTFTISGLFNTGDKVMSLGFGGNATLHGFNLLGNPYSSGLNWNDIINGVYFAYPANTSKGLYFTRDNVQCTYINGVGIPGDVNGIIPPMQGFFTKTYSTGNSITLPAAARTHSTIHPRYKGSSGTIPIVRLTYTENGLKDETVVRLDEAAKPELDYDFDAVKMMPAGTKPSIYTLYNSTKFAINGIPFPETTVTIPVIVNVTKQGTFSISSSDIYGLYAYRAKLRDNVTGVTTNLTLTTEIEFTASPGLLTDRFLLILENRSTVGVDDVIEGEKLFKIYSSEQTINILYKYNRPEYLKGNLSIYDISGRHVLQHRDIEFRNGSVYSERLDVPFGIYIVKIEANGKQFVEKVVVR